MTSSKERKTAMTQSIVLGEDLGMGANKLYGPCGGLEVPSQVSLNSRKRVTARMIGLSRQKPPMEVQTQHGCFYVGAGAHDWGRPLENLDYDRLTGAPEMQALFYASLTRYIRQHGLFGAPLHLLVGMPLEPLSGEDAQANASAVRGWMRGTHAWSVKDESYQVEIAQVAVTSQAVGALFDYALDEMGEIILERAAALKKEVGVISVGFNTMELMVIRERKPVHRFTAGVTAGVRRLLEIVDAPGHYSLGELDARLRTGQLDVREALPVWEREVGGVIEKRWGQAWRRFAVILLVGGGAVVLKDSLPYRFNGKAYIPEDPIISISRGLYKLGCMRASRGRK
jgi:hypothetical protein